jgi:hypothetical protein
MKQVSGTDAKTVALHFLNATTDGRNTPAVIAKTTSQAKNLLSYGYTVSEICATIDYIAHKGIHMHSMGYINKCIGDVLKVLEKEELSKLAQQEKKKLTQAQQYGEVKADVESTERNRQKLARFGTQPGERTQHYFDLLTK